MNHYLPRCVYVCLYSFGFLSQFAYAINTYKAGGFEGLQSLSQQGARCSAIVVNLRTGEKLAEYNPDERLTPASTSKLVLAGAALENWGSEHTFTTRVWARGQRKGSTLEGDLVLEGAGDPSLTNEKLWFLATDIARSGIKKVTGSLVMNTSLFGKIEADSNRAAGAQQSSHAYDSPLSAAAVNFSVMAVVASAGIGAGAPANIALEPYALDTVKLQGNVRTAGKGAAKVHASRARFENGDILNVSGQVLQNSWPTRVYRSVSKADEYAGSVLKAFLFSSGVTVGGKFKVENSQKILGLTPVSAVESFPLDWQLRGLFKMSNNFIADMLTIQLDLDESKKYGATFKGGSDNLQNYMRNIAKTSRFKPKEGPNESGIVMQSGSGLTPGNRLSARDLVALLDRMYFNTREFPSFLAALPIPGAEGTVKNRFSWPGAEHLQSRMRAKTGTLTEPRDAVALGGYTRLKDGDWVAFAVIVNGSENRPSVGVERAKELIDHDLARILPEEK